MNFQRHCHQYLQKIHQTQSDPNATPELSFLPHLKTFLEDVATDSECFDRLNIRFTLEPRTINQIGRPDIIATDGLLPIGYIEAESDSTDLNNLTGHAAQQNQRFRENLDNFILTNFTDFQLWIDGQCNTTSRITDNTDDLEILLERFLNASIQIGTPEALAKYLARRTRELQTQIAATLNDQNSETYQMYKAFRDTLLFTLTPADFADMYAQTLTYGLFAARCTLPNATNFSRHTAVGTLPRSNPFLVQLFYHVASPRLETNVTYILDDIATLLQNVPTAMLRTAFTTRNPLEDPVIHFYETFLKEYNPKLRFDRGVFYTPPQVISYIVRSVDALLKTELNKPDGLADDDTLILDPATGTGGFLLSVLDHIREYVTENYGTGDWNRYINAQLVKRIFGFELLVAPYTIAHLKLSLFLQAQGWNTNERLGIYLTNALEQPDEMQPPLPFAAFISDEANEALSIKRDEPILVILGNPPYQRESANPSRVGRNLTFIGELIENYKYVDETLIKGKDQKRPLQSDYVKFIRWAQWRIDKNGEGVIGYIVNNGFLDGQVFRGMRQHLTDSFNVIYLLNLHGSIRRQEAVPTDQKDENVFDISQGVCILLCVKERGNTAPAKVFYADMWGSREEKYNSLLETDVQSTQWTELHPTSPLYLFVPQVTEHIGEYEHGWNISEIFGKSSTGIFTSRDKVTIQHSEEKIHQVVNDFIKLSEAEVREKYNLKDSKNWEVRVAQSDIRSNPNINAHIAPIRYRPFDTRFTYYTGKSKGFHTHPAPVISPHLFGKANVALCVCRVIKSPIWQYALVTDKITEKCYISNRTSESSYVFPLYLYPDSEALLGSTERELNFKPEFLTALSERLGLPQTAPFQLPEGITPEEIFAYIYAVLYSAKYRQRYYEFLKYDFPRIPLLQDIDEFCILAEYGQELIDLHLLKDRNIPHRHLFEGEGDGVVSKLRYEDGNVWINNTQSFTNVPPEVWEYEIGAYQVCEKWLKDRKGEALSHEEIRLYPLILVSITETLRMMEAIDWVLEF